MKANGKRSLSATFLIALFPLLAMRAGAEDYDREPINYSKAEPKNLVSRLMQDMHAGKVQLKHQAPLGYLPSLLEALQ